MNVRKYIEKWRTERAVIGIGQVNERLARRGNEQQRITHGKRSQSRKEAVRKCRVQTEMFKFIQQKTQLPADFKQVLEAAVKVTIGDGRLLHRLEWNVFAALFD